MGQFNALDIHPEDCMCDPCVIAKAKAIMSRYGPPEILGSLLDMGWRFHEFHADGHVYVDLCPPQSEPEGETQC